MTVHERGTRGESSSGDESGAVSRRSVLQQTALVASIGGVGGIGVTAGTAAAASKCGKDNADDPGTLEIVWSNENETVGRDGCSRSALRGKKVINGHSVQYRFSYQRPDTDEWEHIFMTGSHSVYQRSGYDCNSWERTDGVMGHRVTVDNIYGGYLNNPVSGKEVGGNPPEGSDSGFISDAAEQVAMTAITEAIGAISAPTGIAAGIALGLLGDSNGENETDTDRIMYDWDYSNAKYCGSHFLEFRVKDYKNPALSVTDESWGRYPTYAKSVQNIDIGDPVTESSTSNLVDTVSTGDIIKTSRGESVRVTGTEEQTTQMNDKKRRLSTDSLPSQFVQSYDGDLSSTEFVAFPASVQTRSISGRRLE